MIAVSLCASGLRSKRTPCDSEFCFGRTTQNYSGSVQVEMHLGDSWKKNGSPGERLEPEGGMSLPCRVRKPEWKRGEFIGGR